ncbi:MAG TPA: redox-sensing transcriptional repressor Rex [Thermoanaerobaculia bacterium]|nr:redox-sensing transcriptional repressor Rex [Thermoanaerobaculia bacterium]
MAAAIPQSETITERELISELTTKRLSVYLRCLTFLERNGVRTVSSHEMAKRFHLSSAQIRKDLACFGEFGIRGVGYNVSLLHDRLVHVLGIDRTRKVIISGAGNLGMALAEYRGFNTDGFQIVALLESDPRKTGRVSRSSIPIVSSDELGRLATEHEIEIGIIAVPAEAAQNVYDSMVDAGIRAVLNFAPVQIRKRPHVKIKSVDLRINLESLSFYLRSSEESGSALLDDFDEKLT